MRVRFAVLLAACLLSACSKPKELPPQEVLERAALASQKLNSARFDVDMKGTYADGKGAGDVDLDFDAKGVFGSNGDAVSADVGVRMHWKDHTPAADLAFRGAVTVLGEQETYVKVESMEGNMAEAATPFSGFDHVIGKWMELPATTDPRSVRLTPDPKVLKAQAAVVRVTDNLGLTRDGDRYVYHYRVALDPEAMKKNIDRIGREDLSDLLATGELWIDAQNFYLLRARWEVEKLPLFEGIAQAKINVLLSEHDTAPEVQVPTTATIIDPMSFAVPLRQVSWLLQALREPRDPVLDTL